jgi:hypothetical protein
MTAAVSTLYRIFYDGVLGRLPEQSAIRMGQAALRALPLDRLPSSGCSIHAWRRGSGVRLPNPLILAAMYYDRASSARHGAGIAR